MNQRKCRMFSVLNEEQPASWPHLPLRPLLAVRLAWDVSIKIAERNCLEALPYINRSVLKKRAACIGTVQNEGDWAQPNKHFATQKWRLYRQKPCLPFRAAPKMAQKTEVTLFYASSVSWLSLTARISFSTSSNSFLFMELSMILMRFLQASSAPMSG